MAIINVSDISVEVIKKDIKNLHLWVYPPHGNVRVASPHHIDDEAIRLLVVWKLTWIKKQIKSFVAQRRETVREYVSWESHYYFWKRYLLNVIELDSHSKIKVKIRNKKYIDLYVKKNSSTEQRKKIMDKWLRSKLKSQCEKSLKVWKEITGLEINEFKIRVMKTKWWSCNIEAKKILINFELVKKDKKHLEYIILHELIHLIERNHNDNFKFHLDKYLPNWRIYRQNLNDSILTI